MSDKLEIPARVMGDGSIRFGGSYFVVSQHLRVEGDVLIVSEIREYDDRTRQSVETGRFRLQPI